MIKRISKPIYLSLLAVFTLGSFPLISQNLNTPKVKWLSFDQVEKSEKLEKAPKKIMVDLYSDNCGWCKKMDLSTFQNEFISHYLNENFYPIRFNAQYKKDVTFNDQVFKLDKSGYHELAIALSMGDLGVPTLVFLDEANQIIQPISGYQTVDELERIMFYFANDMYKTTPWNEFVQHYKPFNTKPRIINQDQYINKDVEVVRKKN